jgi:hypothetical protein
MVPSAEPTLYHHALCVTDDVQATASALAQIVGSAPGPGEVTWPAHSPALIGVIVGSAAGAIEIGPLPPELGGRLIPGTTSISFAVDALDERVAACRAAGLDVIVDVEPAAGLSYAVVTVAGLEFELVEC